MRLARDDAIMNPKFPVSTIADAETRPTPLRVGLGEATKSESTATRLGRGNPSAAMRGVVPNASVALVYVVEPDEAVRDSLKALIESNGFCVVDFTTKEKFLSSTEPRRGTCLVLGFSRYGADAIQSLRTLRQHRPDMPIIFVVGQDGASASAVTCGDGFVRLQWPVQEATLIHAIQRTVAH